MKVCCGVIISYMCQMEVTQVFYKHEKTRAQVVAELGQDRSALERFQELRAQVVEHKKTGKGKCAERKSTVSMTHGRREKLVKRSDLFFKTAKYRRKFGSPSEKQNRARGHKKVVYQGVEGVIVPHDSDDSEPDGHIATEYYQDTAQTEHVHTMSDNEGVDEDVVDDKFRQAINQDEANYNHVATGISIKNLLQQVVATSDAGESGASGSGLDRGATARPTRDDTGPDNTTGRTLFRTACVVENPGPAPSRKQSAKKARYSAVGGAGPAGGPAKTTAIVKPGGDKAEGVARGGNAAGAASSGNAAGAASSGHAAVAESASSGATQPERAPPHFKKGRPSTDAVEFAFNAMYELEESDETSTFFREDTSFAKQRMTARYLVRLQDKAKSCKNQEDRALYRAMCETLSINDRFCDLHETMSGARGGKSFSTWCV